MRIDTPSISGQRFPMILPAEFHRQKKPATGWRKATQAERDALHARASDPVERQQRELRERIARIERMAAAPPATAHAAPQRRQAQERLDRISREATRRTK